MKSSDKAISAKAEKLFSELEGGDRMAVYQSYRSVLELGVNAKKVKRSSIVIVQFAIHMQARGHVGPDLTGVKNQPADALLLHVLVANYEIYPAYQ